MEQAVSLSAKANEEKLYGSIPPNSIAKQLNIDLNTSITKDQIVIETPIKTIGEHNVTVQLHPEVQAKIKVVITAEEEVEIEDSESAEETAE